MQPDHFGGGEVEQFEDGAPEVQDNSGLVVLLRAQCQAQERELTSLRSEKITESITQQMSALEESLAKTVSSDCGTLTHCHAVTSSWHAVSHTCIC